MLSIKNLMFKKLAKKLVNWYISPYFIDEVIQITTTQFNENSFSSKYQSDNTNKIEYNQINLKFFADDFFNKFSKCVEKDNRTKYL